MKKGSSSLRRSNQKNIAAAAAAAKTMPTTIFIALQCCQCSTMQVKQQKKSSNKWTCAVCNQKQSVRKVYAQGFMAKDVRHFVQSFNMSRKLVEDHTTSSPQTPLPVPPFEPVSGSQFPAKKITDWTEYLDLNHETKAEEEEKSGNVYEPEIVTELPEELFKKPKLKNHYAKSDTENPCRFRPVFPNRNAHKLSSAKVLTSDKESRNCQLTTGEKSSQWSDYMTGGSCATADQWPRKNRPQLGKQVSVWSDLHFEGGRSFADDHADAGELCQGVLHSAVDQRLEEEIHPDFK